jgi:Uma2 family endonuclease
VVVQTQFISAEAFQEIASRPENAEKSLELIEGVIVEMSRPSWLHGVVTGEIYLYMRLFVKEHALGYVSVEAGYILLTSSEGKATVVGPDVAFVRLERAPNGLPKSGFAPFPPDLAVEIISPNDTVYEINEKIALYLRAGTRLVWVVDPSSSRVTVHQPNQVPVIYDTTGILDGGDVLPGFQLPVRDIFPKTTD